MSAGKSGCTPGPVVATKQLLEMIRWYRQETKKSGIDMHDLARFALARGWKLAPPPSPVDRLARDLSRAARTETRHDKVTGKPYRVNHAYTVTQGQEQLTLWLDIDYDAPRHLFHKSVIKRREQMVDDGVQLSLDLDHWHAIHPNEEPIVVPWDLTGDIEWRKNADDTGEQEAS
jgi:hypothetical protein